MIKGIVLLAWISLSLSSLQEEVQVAATLDRQTAEVSETVVLTVTLRASSLRSPEIRTPELDGLSVISTSDRSSFRFSTATGAVREFSREYSLRVERGGSLTIPPIQVSVDGTLYETEAVLLTAVSSAAISRLPSSLEPRRGEEVAVRLWVEPETAYVGQQVTMTVAAFFDPLVRNRLQRQPEYRPPDVLGFWTADLPGPARPTRRRVGDREYYVQVFRRALFPLSAGRVQIPAAAVIYEVRRGLIYAPETFHVESAPASVTVLPPPLNGRPAGYAGAVGQYEATVSFDRTDVAAGEAVNLILEVQGTGNLRALPRPEFPEVPGFRVYEGAEEGDIQVQGLELAGSKTFSWVLIPESAGEQIVPELSLPYFDPQAATYSVARTEPLTLLVARAATAPVAAARGASALRFIKDRPAGTQPELYASAAFWIALAVPLLALLGLHAFGRYRHSAAPRRARRRQRGRHNVRALRALGESGDASFFAELRSAILAYLEERLRIPALSTQGVVQTQHALEDAGVPPPVTIEIIDLLELCARYRYSPDQPGVDEKLELLNKADRLLTQVDREAVAVSRLDTVSGRGATALILVFGLVAASNAAAGARDSQSEVDRWFQAGVAAYSRGEYSAAAEYFERALELSPGDRHVQYNLGNSYFELGEGGRAVALWMSALRQKPRDADARYNLLLTIGDDPVLGSALPPVPLSRNELAILLAILWVGGCITLIARRRWRRPSLTVSGAAALVLSAIVFTILSAPRADYAVVVSSEAALRAGPVTQSEAIAYPEPGTGYRVEERRGEWLRVTRVGESEGWIDGRQVAVIGADATTGP